MHACRTHAGRLFENIVMGGTENSPVAPPGCGFQKNKKHTETLKREGDEITNTFKTIFLLGETMNWGLRYDDSRANHTLKTLLCLGLLSSKIDVEALTAPCHNTIAFRRPFRRSTEPSQCADANAPYTNNVDSFQTSLFRTKIATRSRQHHYHHCWSSSLVRRSSLSQQNGDQDPTDQPPIEEDSQSSENDTDAKDKAISALSQPKGNNSNGDLSSSSPSSSTPKLTRKSAPKILPPLGQEPVQQSRQKRKMKSMGYRYSSETSPLLPPPPESPPQEPKQEQQTSQKHPSPKKTSSFSSLLPPPFPDESSSSDTVDTSRRSASASAGPFSSGLSSWEEFLGGSTSSDASSDSAATASSSSSSTSNNDRKAKGGSSANKKFTPAATAVAGNNNGDDTDPFSGLPSISDLFPPEFSSKEKQKQQQQGRQSKKEQKSSAASPTEGQTTSSPPSSISSLIPKDDENSLSKTLDGVLPVSELFYRSSQSMSSEDTAISSSTSESSSVHGEEGEDDADQSSEDNAINIQGKQKEQRQDIFLEERDDEELPFSAEQSDQLSTNGGKVKIRRNRVTSVEHDRLEAELIRSTSSRSSDGNKEDINNDNKKKTRAIGGNKYNKKSRGRKMVRRGMEMLVGGIPINADPPQRCIELSYNHHLDDDVDSTIEESSSDSLKEWFNVIGINSRDFGPLLHTSSIGLVSDLEKGLFCEHFVNAAMKWDVCPKELKSIVKTHTLEQMMNDNNNNMIAKKQDGLKSKDAKGTTAKSYSDLIEQVAPSSATSTSNMAAGLNPIQLVEVEHDEDQLDGSTKYDDNSKESNILKKQTKVDTDADNILSLLRKDDSVDDAEEKDKNKKKSSVPVSETILGEGKGFGKAPVKKKKRLSRQDKALRKELESAGEMKFTLGGELKFSIGVTRTELESGHGGAGGNILRRVIEHGIETAIHAELIGFHVKIAKCKLAEDGVGGTDVSVEFNMETEEAMKYIDVDRKAKRINAALAQAMDDGDVQLAMAAAAREEKAWPSKVRDRVVEEFLFEDDDGDGPLDDDDGMEEESVEENTTPITSQRTTEINEYDGPFGMPGSTVYAKDDIFLGGGNDGVFYDYSESNRLNSPYQGTLGPRLIEAVTSRAMQRQPRVIAIGDVHGCIDELQDLLRHCDYQPGDVVVFLGDLVSKGPDSISVVQMAREIGAIGIRGNHDFEVIRWHQAIKSGVDPPVVGSEHFHIASCLSKADMKWMYSLPWYLSSKELGALFVHAGFVSGIRLAKQNPRLMMNMRSILPDGTVTSKFFNNWPWARLWDGPQTVLFGHDADRGLQQYEHAIGLDTGCVYGGRLTACILPEKRLVSVSARREYFKYRRKHYD